MANIYDVPGIEGLIDSSDTTMANLSKVAFGSGLHEQAMRDYLNPFSRNKDVQIGKGAVGDYMSNFLKDYIDPNNQAGGKFGEKGRSPNQMQVVGLGESPNPFTASGIARAAEMAEDPSFQAENVFGEGTLTKVPGGYDYTGGKFDFNFAGPLEEMIFGPSTYGMKFDKDMNVLNEFNRDFRAFDQAKMGQTQGIAKEDDLMDYDEFYDMPEEKKKGILQTLLSKGKDIVGNVFDKIPNVGIMGMLSKLDNFKNLSPLDRQFILQQAGGNRPNKDKYGYNIRSAFGNYANLVGRKALNAATKTRFGIPLTAMDLYYQNKEKERAKADRAILDAAFASGQGGSGQDFTGGRYDGASSAEEYSSNPTGFSGSS